MTWHETTRREATQQDVKNGHAGESTANTLWVVLEPHTALARVRVLQPERVWMAQLEHSRDALAQLAAINALSSMQPLSVAATKALRSCLTSPSNFCRSARSSV